MLTYEFTARDTATGEKVNSEVQAENPQVAAKLIAGQGLSPIDIKLKDNSSSGINKYLHRVKTKDKVLFSRQLSTLINAGLPLVQSLRNVSRQTGNKKIPSGYYASYYRCRGRLVVFDRSGSPPGGV